MSKNENEKNCTLTIKRTFNASINLVWEVWTQPGHIANWWGPKGMEIRIDEHDFRVGGAWKYTMPTPGGGEFVSEGINSEIVELERVFTSANMKPMTEGVELQAIFAKNGDKTNFTFNVIHPTEAYCQQQEKMGFYNGWGSAFDRLDTVVGGLKNVV